MTALCAALVVATLGGESPAAGDEAAVRQEIRQTYSFSPHELTSQQIDEKSKVLDDLWSRARARKDTYIPVLRSELARDEAQPFFLFDGSMLLLSLTDTAPDRRTALRAIARCDLRDVQHGEYFRQVHRLAALGEDTTDAALHILAEPQFKVSIPQHALTLGQDYALIYMVFPMEQDRWEPRALARLGVETEPKAQKSLLVLSWYAQSPEADTALSAFADDVTKPAASREFARELLARAAGPAPPATASPRSEAYVRSERREIMKRVSDEALMELDVKTAELLAVRKPSGASPAPRPEPDERRKP